MRGCAPDGSPISATVRGRLQQASDRRCTTKRAAL